MDFYEEFIEKYDRLISWENRFKRESGFFKELFSQNKIKTVLDCACGTGQHVVMFNQLGLNAKGSDLSPAMIKKAKANAKSHKIKAELKIADFRNLAKSFKEKFDAVVCVGNSLPHLMSDEDLSRALIQMHDILKEGGLLIVEQRNYDKLVALKKRFLPMPIRDNEVFFYVLDYFPQKIIFNVVNVEIKSKKFSVYSTDYNPLKKAKLTRLLRNVGFENLKFYGNFDFGKFDIKKDDSLIIVCHQPLLTRT